MPERVDTVVIGAGQAGLATSYHLTRLGREHVVLERGAIANTWRTERWDGFYLNTPRWTQALPGGEYDGPDPDGFSSLAQTISYFDEYAAGVAAPVRTGAEAVRLTVANGVFRVELDGDAFEAANVVVATGAYQRPTPTAAAERLPDDVFHPHTSEYRNPEELPAAEVRRARRAARPRPACSRAARPAACTRADRAARPPRVRGRRHPLGERLPAGLLLDRATAVRRARLARAGARRDCRARPVLRRASLAAQTKVVAPLRRGRGCPVRRGADL